MNLLTSKLPTTLTIDDVEYPIRTEFQPCLKVILAFADPELTKQEKAIVLLNNLYGKDHIPTNKEKAIEQGVWFLNCGKELQEASETPLYSFSQDSVYIRSAIEKSHHINLDAEPLHWWRFIYMFFDLDSNCFFHQLLSLRQKRAKGKLTPDEKRYVEKNKELIYLQNDELVEAKDEYDRFMELWEGGVED